MIKFLIRVNGSEAKKVKAVYRNQEQYGIISTLHYGTIFNLDRHSRFLLFRFYRLSLFRRTAQWAAFSSLKSVRDFYDEYTLTWAKFDSNIARLSLWFLLISFKCYSIGEFICEASASIPKITFTLKSSFIGHPFMLWVLIFHKLMVVIFGSVILKKQCGGLLLSMFPLFDKLTKILRLAFYYEKRFNQNFVASGSQIEKDIG